jgi:hypothetical protein
MLKNWLPLTLAFACSLSAAAADLKEFTLVIKDHRFHPERLEVPADMRIKLIVDNQDNSPEEFESYELNREKVIPGNTRSIIFVGPLKPGEYPFFGEFNMDTANGLLIVNP